MFRNSLYYAYLIYAYCWIPPLKYHSLLQNYNHRPRKQLKVQSTIMLQFVVHLDKTQTICVRQKVKIIMIQQWINFWPCDEALDLNVAFPGLNSDKWSLIIMTVRCFTWINMQEIFPGRTTGTLMFYGKPPYNKVRSLTGTHPHTEECWTVTSRLL